MLDDTDASAELKKAISAKYEIVDLLGKGSYGRVLKGICKETSRKVALKITTVEEDRQYDNIRLLREI